MDFELPPDLEAARRRNHRFAARSMRPRAREYDEREHDFPRSMVEEANREGVRRPEPGVGISALGAAVVVEELAWGDPGLLRCLPGVGLAGVAITTNAPPEQADLFLALFKQKDPAWGCMAMTEPGAGSDTSAIRTSARRDGDSWVLNGEKVFASNADLALDRGLIVVWAKVLPPGARSVDDVSGHIAMTPFVVPAGTPGAKVAKLEQKMGLRAAHTALLLLEECRVPLHHRLGWTGDDGDGKTRGKGGFGGAMATFDANRPVVAAAGLGSARAALELLRETLEAQGLPIEYGASPHRQPAAVRAYLDMETQLHAARLLIWKACWLVDQGRPHAMEAAMAKALGGQLTAEITQRVAGLLGPLGVSGKWLAEKWMRDAKVTDIFEGTAQVQRLIVARRILGYGRKELK